jgi:hypothetical protein
MYVTRSVGSSGHSVGMGWDLCVMVSWCFKVQKNRIKEKWWGGGYTRVLFQFGITTGFPG